MIIKQNYVSNCVLIILIMSHRYPMLSINHSCFISTNNQTNLMTEINQENLSQVKNQ